MIVASTTNGEASHKAVAIDPRRDPEAWIKNNERISNELDVPAWLALYAEDAVFEAITDGAVDRVEGYERIAASVRAMATIMKRHRLQVKKRFVAAQGDVIVNAWSGGFAGRERQFGIEIWTLRGARVVRQEQYMFMDVRPSESSVAKLRAIFSGELVIKMEVAKERAAQRSALR
jgi:ketosteroid isomerase-like protein